MNRRLFILATLGFWVAVAAFRLSAPGTPPASKVAVSSAVFTLEEVATHNTPDDCWMAIDGGVYDLTAYLPRHPAAPAVFTAWCGKDASRAYRTKGVGRPHSAYADGLLAGYRIGSLRGE